MPHLPLPLAMIGLRNTDLGLLAPQDGLVNFFLCYRGVFLSRQTQNFHTLSLFAVRVLQAGVSLSEPCSQDLSEDFDARELVDTCGSCALLTPRACKVRLTQMLLHVADFKSLLLR
jgi:hypothetical protein